MGCAVIGHGLPPESIERAERVYVAAWHWRSTHHDEWQAIIEAAEHKAEHGERIVLRQLIAGTMPQSYAPIVARWLASEHPQLLPHIETRRSAYDVLFIGAHHGRA